MSGIDQILSSVVKIFLVVPTFHSRQELNSVQQWGSCTVVNKFLNKVRNNHLLIIHQHQCFHVSPSYSLRKKYSYSELFWSAFARIRIEHGEIRVSLRIQSEYGKMWTRITPNTDTFHAVLSSTELRSILFYLIFST